ncbi:glycosyltransferase family 4 protein [Marivirga sp.]|uniref:glycosyltransferase family 4 protein n=1 Tax=Marivirga sp. TaxID=2018662 RepID=UPI003DA74583
MEKKLKVLLTIRQGLVGGGETHVHDLATNIDLQKFKPIVLSFTEGPMVEALRVKGIETYVIYSKVPFDPRVRRKVMKLVKDKKVDVIHAHGTRAASNTISVSKKLKIPFIYTVHGWSFNDSQSYFVRRLRIQAEKYITKNSDQVICVSESNRLTGENNIKGFKAIVINNGISFEKFDFNIDRLNSRKLFGLSDNEIWVGFIARLTFQKDPLTLIKGFNRAYSKEKNLRLLIVGEGELDSKVNDLITNLNLSNVIKRLPFQKNIPQLLAAIDIYSLVSLWEGLPIGLLEAMAMKKAIIASEVDGTKEIIQDGKNGILISPSDINAISNAISKYIKNKDLIKKYGEEAFLSIRRDFNLDVMVENNQSTYLNLIK